MPLIAGLLPAIATATAFWISVANDYISYCNPFIDGCISISRSARHGLGNHIFRALVLPAATLQGLTWLLCTAWFRELGANGRSLKWLAALGVVAGIFLVLYGTFLGTEGDAYRWLRRYGTIVYFGCTYLCNLIAAGQVRALSRARALDPPARLDVVLVVLVAITLLMGLASVFIAPLAGSEDLKNRLENVVEWFGATSFTLFFFALAWLWQRTGFGARLEASPGRRAGTP